MLQKIFTAADLAGRLLLVAIFAIEAWTKLKGYDGAVAYMEKFGLPGFLLPPAIIVEGAGAVLIAIGCQTRIAALFLAGFCVVTAIVFHNNLGNGNEQLHFLKDLAIAGGFLILFARGPGAWSVDGN